MSGIVCKMKRKSDSCFFKWAPAATKLVTTQQNKMQETQLIHWKPNQLKFCMKITFLSPDELTVVKKEKVIYFTKVGEGGRAVPPFHKKVGGWSPLSPQLPRFRRLCESIIYSLLLVESN